jgi:hypothetical protein
MVAMVYPMSRSHKKWPEPTKEAPSPLRVEGGGEGEQRTAVRSNTGCPLSLALMELLATRLSPQAGKSMVIPREGGGGHAGEQSLCCRRPDNEIMETTP